MKKRPTAPARYSTAHAVFLCIDSATTSGAAILVPIYDSRDKFTGKFEAEAFGAIKTQVMRETFVRDAVDASVMLKIPLIVVAEEWTHHGMSNAAFVSLCENFGKWLAEIERAELSKDIVVRANPNRWHNDVFGPKHPKHRAGLKALAVSYVQRILKLPIVSDDIAEALLLGVWGQHAAEVHEVLHTLKKAA